MTHRPGLVHSQDSSLSCDKLLGLANSQVSDCIWCESGVLQRHVVVGMDLVWVGWYDVKLCCGLTPGKNNSKVISNEIIYLDIRAPDKMRKMKFNWLYLSYFFTKSSGWPLVRIVSKWIFMYENRLNPGQPLSNSLPCQRSNLFATQSIISHKKQAEFNFFYSRRHLKYISSLKLHSIQRVKLLCG